MKLKTLAAAITLGLASSMAHADQATIDAFNEAGVVLTEEQSALLAASSCTDEASCNALSELVSDIAASSESDAAIEAAIVAFSQAHPEQAEAAIEKTIAKSPTAAIALAAVAIELAPAAAGAPGLATAAQAASNNRANARALATPAAAVLGGATASPN